MSHIEVQWETPAELAAVGHRATHLPSWRDGRPQQHPTCLQAGWNDLWRKGPPWLIHGGDRAADLAAWVLLRVREGVQGSLESFVLLARLHEVISVEAF